MPVVPSFKGYAEKPDLAGAYLGARRADIAAFQAATEAQLGRQRLAQDAAQVQARIALGQQELESRRVQNEMELAARKETQEREHLRKQQEAEILKSYRDTQIGMQERRLAVAEAAEAQRIQEAANAFDQQQYFTKRFSELMSQPGMTSEKAASQAVLEIGPKATGFSSALSPAREPSERKYSVVAGQDILGTPTRLPMTAPEFQSWYQTAPPQLQTNTVNQAIQQMLQPPASVTGTNAPANEVIRRTKDGRRAVFDAQTKKFIRFMD